MYMMCSTYFSHIIQYDRTSDMMLSFHVFLCTVVNWHGTGTVRL